MDVVTESERNPVSKHQIQTECGKRAGSRGTERPNQSREAKLSGVNGDGGKKLLYPIVSDHERDL